MTLKKAFIFGISVCLSLAMGISSFAAQTEKGDFTDEQYEQYISTDFYKNTVYPKEATVVPRASLPLASYPSGSYFSNSGNACTHHKSGCNINGSCGCKSYNNSIQCMGFANYVFKQYNGVDCVSSNANGKLTNITAASLKTYFNKLTVGSHFRYMGTNGIPHSFIVKSKTTTGITVYEANYDSNNCVVGQRTITYENLAKQVKSVTNSWTA